MAELLSIRIVVFMVFLEAEIKIFWVQEVSI
jgi:hypothetical protein